MPPQSPLSLLRGLPKDAAKSLWRQAVRLTSTATASAEPGLSGNYDVVVVGAGVHGSATAAELAARGKRVLLLEQFDLLHRRGSSHGESRITRRTYPQLWYTRMMTASFECWDALFSEARTSCFTCTGGLDFAISGDETLAALKRSASEVGIPHEVLTPEQVNARFPGIRLPQGFEAVYHPDAGVLAASKAVAMLHMLCKLRGGVLMDRTPVLSMRTTQAGVEVHTSRGRVTAGRCVIAAGAWTAPLLRDSFGYDLSSVLSAVPVAVSYWRVRDAESAEHLAASNCPVSICYTAASLGAESIGVGAEFYTTPVLEMPGLVKISLHLPKHLWGPPVADPGSRLLHPPEDVVRRHVTAFVEQHFPGVDASSPALVEPCLYTCTPDHDFIIDALPETHNKVWLVSACSGHGKLMRPLPSTATLPDLLAPHFTFQASNLGR